MKHFEIYSNNCYTSNDVVQPAFGLVFALFCVGQSLYIFGADICVVLDTGHLIF